MIDLHRLHRSCVHFNHGNQPSRPRGPNEYLFREPRVVCGGTNATCSQELRIDGREAGVVRSRKQGRRADLSRRVGDANNLGVAGDEQSQ
jgi:hypothetical protein